MLLCSVVFAAAAAGSGAGVVVVVVVVVVCSRDLYVVMWWPGICRPDLGRKCMLQMLARCADTHTYMQSVVSVLRDAM